MNKMMIRMLSVLIMLLMAFEADGSQNGMWATPEDASTAVMKEAEMSVPQYRRRKRVRQRQGAYSRRKSQATVAKPKNNAVIIKDETAEPKEVHVCLDSLTTNYVAQDGSVISGTAGSYQLTIADKATVVLNGVDIINIPNRTAYEYAGITCEGDATIVLAEGTTNHVMGGYENYPGIYVPEGKTLTIKGSGTLESSSQGWAAGIGGGKDLACGNIVIEGGIIIAKGGKNAAVIGSGWFGSCGDIVIQPSVKRVKLITQGYGGSTIGAGKDATCGTVTIADGALVE